MSSAGRAANSNGCVSKPKEHATGLIGFAAQIRRSSLIGSCAMETAEHREPCESRGSRTDLGAPGGEIPPGDSTNATDSNTLTRRRLPGRRGRGPRRRRPRLAPEFIDHKEKGISDQSEGEIDENGVFHCFPP